MKAITGVSTQALLLGAHESSIHVLYKLAFVLREYLKDFILGTNENSEIYYALTAETFGLNIDYRKTPIFGSSNIQFSMKEYQEHSRYQSFKFDN